MDISLAFAVANPQAIAEKRGLQDTALPGKSIYFIGGPNTLQGCVL